LQKNPGVVSIKISREKIKENISGNNPDGMLLE
jgi:hypothetical protein